MAWKSTLTASNLEDLYVWIDKIPLSRPKRKIERDFADGILVAEIVRHYFPDMIDMHNYSSNSSIGQKRINWGTLNRKVLERFDLNIPETIINDVCNAKPGVIELVLFNLKSKLNGEIEPRKNLNKQPQKQKILSTPKSLLSLNSIGTINEGKSFLSERTSRTIKPTLNKQKNVLSRLDYEELKQQCLIQQEEIQVLHVKMRRLEHTAHLKDDRITELAATIKECPHIKSNTTGFNKHKKK